MYQKKATLRVCGTLLAVFAVAAIFGCHTCNDITPGAIPQPNGTYMCQWIHAEKARAEQDKFVIYQYEWSADGTKLTPSGHEHIAQIAPALSHVPCPIVIEPSANRCVDDSRRGAVLDALASCGNPTTPDRVFSGGRKPKGCIAKRPPASPAGCSAHRAVDKAREPARLEVVRQQLAPRGPPPAALESVVVLAAGWAFTNWCVCEWSHRSGYA